VTTAQNTWDAQHLEVYVRNDGSLIGVVLNPDEERNSLRKIRVHMTREQTAKLIENLQLALKIFPFESTN
jgi:hypothetical protein